MKTEAECLGCLVAGVAPAMVPYAGAAISVAQVAAFILGEAGGVDPATAPAVHHPQYGRVCAACGMKAGEFIARRTRDERDFAAAQAARRKADAAARRKEAAERKKAGLPPIKYYKGPWRPWLGDE